MSLKVPSLVYPPSGTKFEFGTISVDLWIQNLGHDLTGDQYITTAEYGNELYITRNKYGNELYITIHASSEV